MNGKKAKRLRRLARQEAGTWRTEWRRAGDGSIRCVGFRGVLRQIKKLKHLLCLLLTLMAGCGPWHHEYRGRSPVVAPVNNSPSAAAPASGYYYDSVSGRWGWK